MLSICTLPHITTLLNGYVNSWLKGTHTRLPLLRLVASDIRVIEIKYSWVCRVISKYHVFKGLCDFMGGNTSICDVTFQDYT